MLLSRTLGVGHDFQWIGLLVAIYVPISSGYFVVGIWHSGGVRAFGQHSDLSDFLGEYIICIDEFAEMVMETNLEGSPNSP
ncbi:unnamed protein product [Prunus brigantina]